ncbi:MAG: DUF4421 domain-containing protein [Bacteroidales bacterium]|nr:DUF4421 domain-containing protein [Bacteroidales bacterium]
MNLNTGDFSTKERYYQSANINFNFVSMNAFGYNGRKFFTGVNFITEGTFSRIEKKLNTEIGFGKASFFVGYRIRRN